jgi:hypothetical protein
MKVATSVFDSLRCLPRTRPTPTRVALAFIVDNTGERSYALSKGLSASIDGLERPKILLICVCLVSERLPKGSQPVRVGGVMGPSGCFLVTTVFALPRLRTAKVERGRKVT